MSNRYETNYWKKEDWEAHNRLMNAAIERQREEFLTDNHNLEIASNMIIEDLNFIYNGILNKKINSSIFRESIAQLEIKLKNIVDRISIQKKKWEGKS